MQVLSFTVGASDFVLRFLFSAIRLPIIGVDAS
jgi:hypothetical protein